MAVTRYAEEDANFCFTGDTVKINGALTATGAVTLTGGRRL